MEMETERLPVESRAGAGSALIERIVRQVGVSSSAATVYGQPVEAHGYTVIPVARVYFMYGGGSGPELGGRLLERPIEGRTPPSLTSGGGGGGMGIARPAGHIEISAHGTRFVPAARDWKRALIVAVAAGAGVALLRLRR